MFVNPSVKVVKSTMQSHNTHLDKVGIWICNQTAEKNAVFHAREPYKGGVKFTVHLEIYITVKRRNLFRFLFLCGMNLTDG